MPTVEVPGVGNVEFPDSMTDEQIAAAIKNNILPQASQTDQRRYKNYPISTFLANAVNAATFGLPEYLNKTFTPETYAEGQRYQAANPLAANLGTATGEVAGYAVPGAYGLVKGGQLGARAATGLANRFIPEAVATPGLRAGTTLYGRAQGAMTGGVMGAQTGAAIPGVVTGDPGRAVAAPSVVNQFSPPSLFHHLGPVTGNIVPAAAGVAATQSQEMQNRMRMLMQLQAAKKVLGQE